MKDQHNNFKKTAEVPAEVKPVIAARSLLVGEALGKDSVVRWLPFLFFIFLLAMIYIANTYYAEKTIRAIDKTNTELKELSTEFISIKSELMFRSKPSEVAKLVSGMGIKESVVPPKKIIIPEIKED